MEPGSPGQTEGIVSNESVPENEEGDVLHPKSILLKQWPHATDVGEYAEGAQDRKLSIYLKTATLFMSMPISYVCSSGDDPDRSKVIGRSGTKIVFSCTWKENRKNDSDDVRSAYGSNGSNGVG